MELEHYGSSGSLQCLLNSPAQLEHYDRGVSWQSLFNFVSLAFALGMFCGWRLHEWCLEDEKEIAEKTAAKEAAGAATETMGAAGKAASPASSASGGASKKRDQRVQGPVTYRRDLAQPRYQPLAGWQWGATEKYPGLF